MILIWVKTKHIHLKHMISAPLRICLLAWCMITLHDENLFFLLNHLGVCSSLSKPFYLKLSDVLVNLGKILTGQNRNLTEYLHNLALISTPAYQLNPTLTIVIPIKLGSVKITKLSDLKSLNWVISTAFKSLVYQDLKSLKLVILEMYKNWLS